MSRHPSCKWTDGIEREKAMVGGKAECKRNERGTRGGDGAKEREGGKHRSKDAHREKRGRLSNKV